MHEQEVITIKIVRPNLEDRVVCLEGPLKVSQAREELREQFQVEGSLRLDGVILESAMQLEVDCLYTLLFEHTAGKYSSLDA